MLAEKVCLSFDFGRLVTKPMSGNGTTFCSDLGIVRISNVPLTVKVKCLKSQRNLYVFRFQTHEGLFINDVTQVGVRCSHFCDTIYGGLSKTGNLV